MGYSKHSVKLWLDLAGTTVDVVTAQYGYALNTIPMAQLVLAAGVNTTTLQPSPANALAGNTSGLIKAKLWLEMKQEFSDDPTSIKLDGTKMIFEGYLVFVGSEIRRDGIGIDAALIHWLSDLNHGSCISASSHPENPAQLAFNAALDNGGGGGAVHFLPTTLAQQHLTAGTIGEDLWGKGILPWFKELASTDRINAAIFGRNDDPDKSVVAALNRFNGDKLPLNMDDLDSAEVAEAIYQDISASVLTPNNNHFAAMANITLWDKLVGDLAATYMFAIVPGPDWAKVVPFIGGLRTPWLPGLAGGKISLRARDDTAARIQSQLIRPIGGYGLYGTFGAAAGGLAPGATLPIEYSIGGGFKGGDKGLIIIKRVPRWADLLMFPGGIPVAPGTNGEIAAVAQDPGIGAAPAKAPENRFLETNALCNRLAHAFYVDEVLKNRTATIVTVPRFDICPGSTVSIQAVNTDKQDAAYFATVIKVSYEISADPPNIRTIFSLAHVRTAAENKDDRTSIAQHPLYNRVWKGDFLIDPNGAGAVAGGGGNAIGADVQAVGIDPNVVA